MATGIEAEAEPTRIRAMKRIAKMATSVEAGACICMNDGEFFVVRGVHWNLCVKATGIGTEAEHPRIRATRGAKMAGEQRRVADLRSS